VFTEDDLLPLSALQHLLFCERQCALQLILSARTNEAFHYRHHAGKEAGAPSSPPELDLPPSLRRDPAAGLLSDPVEGFLFLGNYGGFLDLFARPQEHIGRPETAELLFAYLEDPVISDVPFRRVQKRFPEAFNKVLANCRHEFDVTVNNRFVYLPTCANFSTECA